MKGVQLVVFDFDGVMTDNRVLVHQSGEEAVLCHRGDGWGIARLKAAGFDVLVLSTEANAVVSARCRKLKIEAVQACDDKLTALRARARQRGLGPSQIAYVGNDANDLACMRWVAWPIAVADATVEARALAKWVTRQPGGHGAAREVADRLIAARSGSNDFVEQIRQSAWRSIHIAQAIASSEELLAGIGRAAQVVAEVLGVGRDVLILSRKNSAAHAAVLAAQFRHLGENVRTVTVPTSKRGSALAPGLEAQAQVGDLLIGITQGADSNDLARVMSAARHLGLRTLAFLDASSGHLESIDHELLIPTSGPMLFLDACLLVGQLLSSHAKRALSGAVFSGADAADTARG
jgi:YrbI family 3-deoxy-D-manno-octulosonate 8-phosphate phosphatase